MQQTNFRFEVLVHDDASTDGTADIIRQYEARYPHLFKCWYQTENQFLKQNVLVKILYENAKGKYRALCEGDDYWLEPHKLQKQVDFLETNPAYSLCYHRIKTQLMQGDARDYDYSEIEGDELNFEEATLKHYIPTASLTFRVSMLNLQSWFADKNSEISGDIVMTLSLLMNGPGHFDREAMAVKRRHKMSLTHSNLFKEHYNNHINYTFIFENLDRDTKGKYRELLRKRIIPHRKGVLLGAIRNGDLKVVFQSIGILLKYWIK